MATFRKRGKRWRVEICHRGLRYSKSFPTKQECQILATHRLYELEHGIFHPASKKTLREALDRYAAEEVPKKKVQGESCCSSKKSKLIQSQTFCLKMLLLLNGQNGEINACSKLSQHLCAVK